MYVFVYGTLKRGYWNNYLLKTSEFVCEAITYDKFALYNFKYPFAVHEDNEDGKLCLPVKGEVYNLDSRATLDKLDELEIQYERHNRPIITEQYGILNAFVYEYPWANPFGFTLLCDTENNSYVWKG